jgi:glycosyltransferase involved in cell wall biosynthesis
VSYGGPEQVVDVLARGLTAAGHEVRLFTTGDATCPVERRWVFDVPPSPMTQVTPEAFHVLAAYDALADVDVIHDHTSLGPLVAPAASCPPIVATNHGPFNEATRRIYRRAAERASIVAISASQADEAGPGVPIAAVIHHGIDVSAIPVGSGDGGYVLFLGRMAPEKGAHVAVDAARAAGVPIRLAAKCREDAEVAYFEREIRPRLCAEVTFEGEVGGDEKLELLGAAVALVNPISWSEPFGLVMAEALAAGTPVITTPFGAAPEIVDDAVTGYICRDRAELETRIADATTLSRRACRKAAEGRFAVELMVEHHLDLYRALGAD